MHFKFPPWLQTWLWLAFFASFAVKMPMWPVHTWLPDAHVEAPTAGSVILAGILLKMGGYGFLRFSLPMFPVASELFAPLVFALSVIAIIYTSLVALMQDRHQEADRLFVGRPHGLRDHGHLRGQRGRASGRDLPDAVARHRLGALFLCVGVVYDRMHTREIAAYGGLVNRMPKYAATFMVFTMANVGLPGTSGFVGEILTMTGAYKASTWTALVAASGVIFSAVYALTLYRRVMFGEIVNPELKTITDLDKREIDSVFRRLAGRRLARRRGRVRGL
jgi:NADH-quinone oxidoreductase subunit M